MLGVDAGRLPPLHSVQFHFKSMDTLKLLGFAFGLIAGCTAFAAGTGYPTNTLPATPAPSAPSLVVLAP
jgi:hypothetical protein